MNLSIDDDIYRSFFFQQKRNTNRELHFEYYTIKQTKKKKILRDVDTFDIILR